MAWPLQDAKNKLSEVVRAAQEKPQIILVRGEEKAVVVSAVRYRELTLGSGTLVSFLQASPWSEVETDIERSKDTGRDVEL